MAAESSASNLVGLSRLLVLPKYSDLQIVCKGETFPVHKAIVCSQSPVFAAAVDGDFKEAKTGVIVIEKFDISTVRCMVCFMYGVKYETEKSDNNVVALDISEENNAENASVKEDSDSEIPPRAKNSGTDIVLRHIKVNSIADYYDIPPLREYANTKIQNMIENNWNASGFPQIVEEAFTSTSDVALHQILTSATTQHIDELMLLEDFPKLLVMEDFFLQAVKDKFRALGDQLAKTESRVQDVQRELAMALLQENISSERASRLEDRLDELIRRLGATDFCRNVSCEAEFRCYIERGGSTIDPRFTLRCSRCHCRHK